MNRSEAVESVVNLMYDGNRVDRYLRKEGGSYYLTDAESYIGPDGPFNPPNVKIDWFESMTLDDFDFYEKSRLIIEKLDELIESETVDD